MKTRGKEMMAILVGKDMGKKDSKGKKCSKCKGKCSCSKY